MKNKTWKQSIIEALEKNGELWTDVESHTLTDDQLTWSRGYEISFTVWTKWRVYFPLCYDGDYFVGSVIRNPDGKPTRPQGGG